MESRNGHSRARDAHIVDDGGPSGVIAGIVVVALLALAFFLFINWDGGSRTVDVDVPAVS